MGARVMALQEQAEELGFSTIQDAIDAGYEVAYKASGDHQLYKPDEQELAHRAWLEEKREVLNDLDIVAHSDSVPFEHKEIVKHAIEFIRKGEC